MSYSTVAGARSKVPALKNLSDKQVEAFISTFNALIREGKSEEEVFPIAMAAAQKVNKSMETKEDKIDKIYNWLEKHFGGSEKEHVEIIKARNEELKQATHIVYQPNVPDLHGEWMSEDTIRKACHSFNMHCRKANLFHKVETDKVDIVESYILPVNAKIGNVDVKKGTWLAVLQYKDDALWEMEKSGEIQGVSIGARGRKKSILKSYDSILKSEYNLDEYTELTDVNFEFEGAHLAVVHKDQGGAANGVHYALITKSTNNISEEELDEIIQKDFGKAKVEMRLDDFLAFFLTLPKEKQEEAFYSYEQRAEGKVPVLNETFFEDRLKDMDFNIEFMKSLSVEDIKNLTDEQRLKVKLFQSEVEKSLLSNESINKKGDKPSMADVDIEKAFEESELYKSLKAEIEFFKKREEERKEKELKEAIKAFEFISEDKIEDVANVLKALDEDKQNSLLEVFAKASEKIKDIEENQDMFVQKSVSYESDEVDELKSRVLKAAKGEA